MAISTVFINNRTQAVRLPAEVCLPEGVKRVSVRAIGNERIIAPVENTWDSVFINRQQVSLVLSAWWIDFLDTLQR